MVRRRALDGLAAGMMLGLVLTGGGCRARLEDQLELGSTIYQKRCAACHEGGNRTAPELSATLLARYGTATKLFNYVSTMMPQDAPGSLSPEEYWAIAAFLLKSNGMLGDGSALDAGTADGVLLRQ